ncbi:hypothetical protein SLW70_13205 [Flavobacterium sp. NG2]|uniref:hypothetical protein n=1 Tax=Flavobacterium sp. NG2 TaxID=3097547 RepID=UPI002A837EF6|nr:hypothetical protein [Flavobacterium sp. NG2]WPR70882.1 hypothetical protein SLW70_13205 [Flavobacterium sp. NG2]
MNKFYFIFISCFLLSCSPKIKTSIVEKQEKASFIKEVVVIPENTTINTKYKKIGETQAGDSGFTVNCGYNLMINLLKNEALKNGANALRITKHIYPSLYGSSCHRFKADLLFVEDIDSLKNSLNISRPIQTETNDFVANKRIENGEPSTVTETTTNGTLKKDKASKFVVIANVGPSFRVAKTPDNTSAEQKAYIKKLKSGLGYELTAYYMKDENTGFGFKYNVHKSSGSLSNQTMEFGDGSVWTGTISDAIAIQFIGASFLFTEGQNARVGEGTMELALGYMSYKDIASFSGNRMTIKGGNLGIVGGFGYHFRISPSFLVGPQVNFVGAVLNKVTVNYADGSSEKITFKEDEKENLWRIDLALGAKFRF